MKPLTQTKGPQHVKTNQWRGEPWTGRVNSIHWSLQGLLPAFISEKEVLIGANKCQVSSCQCKHILLFEHKAQPPKMQPRYEKRLEKVTKVSRMSHRKISGCLFFFFFFNSAIIICILPVWLPLLNAYQPVCYRPGLQTRLSTSF